MKLSQPLPASILSLLILQFLRDSSAAADFVAVAAPAALAFCICSFCMKHSDMRYIFGNFIVASLAFKLFAHARFFFGFRVIS